ADSSHSLGSHAHRDRHSFPTRRSSDLEHKSRWALVLIGLLGGSEIEKFNLGQLMSKRIQLTGTLLTPRSDAYKAALTNEFATKRSEEHTSELQSRFELVCRLLLEKKNK